MRKRQRLNWKRDMVHLSYLLLRWWALVGERRVTVFFFFSLVTPLIFSSALADDRRVPVNNLQIQLSFAPIVDETAPAVVNIYAKKLVQRQNRRSLFDDPFFNRFFGAPTFRDQSRVKVENSLGSGVIVAKEGLVVTNHHVIADASEIRIVMRDKREFDATLLLSDARTDIAVLQIKEKGLALPFLQFTDSDQLKIGDLVIAIGNPFGVGQTVTSGIVSGLARTSVGVSDFRSFIQTDAAINPGNSGGALVNLAGKVVGINTAIYSKSGGSLGIGFAVPANMVQTVVNSAIKGEKLLRPWMSFTGRNMDHALANAMGLTRPDGVLIEQLAVDGPAYKAGLRPGDIIMKVDGIGIEDVHHLRFRLALKGVGMQATIEYLRKKKPMTTLFDLEAPPEVPLRDLWQIAAYNPFQGATVANMSPRLADELGGTFPSGVTLLILPQQSMAAKLGLRLFDVILAVNGQAVNTVENLRTILAKSPIKWRLTIEREGRQRVMEYTKFR